MTRQTVLFLAGFQGKVAERIDAEANAAFCGPHGLAVMKPLRDRYSAHYAEELIDEAVRWVVRRPESDPISCLLIYVGKEDQNLPAFIKKFHPFAFAVQANEIDTSHCKTKAHANAVMNAYITQLKDTAVRMRKKAAEWSTVLEAPNHNPWLLPLQNFEGDELHRMLSALNAELLEAASVRERARSLSASFVQQHKTHEPSNKQRKCFFNGSLYFKSPGRALHGHMSYADVKSHRPSCILAGRSRLGGTFHHAFHYDCEPQREMRAAYPNCHSERVAPPRESHLNIAPNDFIR